MDILAEKIGMDTLEVRRKNFLREGEKDACGQDTIATGVRGCLDKAAEWIELDKEPPFDHVWRKGKGVAVGSKYTVSMPSSSSVKVYRDGTVEVRSGNVEIGQGVNTVLAQIAAEEFGISIDRVKVLHGDTSTCPPDYGCVSSRSTFFSGNALKLACQDAKRRVFELASSKLGVNADKLSIKNGRVFITAEPNKSINIANVLALEGGEILGTGHFYVPMSPEDPETGQSERITAYYSHFSHGVEVAVNIETGEVRVLKIVGVADGGTIINPKMAEAQVEGALLQGIGISIYEHISLEKGAVANADFTDYKLPTAQELPSDKNIKVIFASVPHPEGPFGAKGLGEGPLISIAPAIGNAIYNAVGIRIKDLPFSREKVLDALREKGIS
jgi:CO/xanthine dehydrogenase Mo-binding subunit